MRIVLLAFMFLLSMNVYSQQTVLQENGMVVLKDSSIINNKDSMMVSQSSMNTHSFLAEKYRHKSKDYRLGAIVLGVVGVGSVWIGIANFEVDMNIDLGGFDVNVTNSKPRGSSGSDSSWNSNLCGGLIIGGSLCIISAIVCTIKSIKYHHKAGKELKLSVSGTTAHLAFTF